MKLRLRILHLEDDPGDVRLIRETLRADGLPAEIKAVDDRAGLQTALQAGDFDIILADYKVPGFGGLESLSLAQKTCPEKPFLFVTGAMGEDRAVETLKSGATDVVLKDHLSRLGSAVRRALAEAEEHSRRRKAEQALRESEERLRQSLQIGRMFAFDWDLRSDAIVRSTDCAEILGGERDTTRDTGQTYLARIHPPDAERLRALCQQLRPGADRYRTTYRLRRGDGTLISLEETGRGFFDSEGRLIRVVGITADVTVREQAQQALRWELAVNEAVSHLSTPLISPETTMEEVAGAVLAQALKLTGSKDGLVSAIDPATNQNICHALTKVMAELCHRPAHDGRAGGPLDEEALSERVVCQLASAKQGFYRNRRSGSLGSKAVFDLPVDRVLAMPIFLLKELVGQIVVADSERDYTDQDLSAVRRLAERYALGIQGLRFKQALQSERDFVQAILATAGALVVVLDTRGQIVRFNQACESVTGYRFGEVAGKAFWNLFLAPEEVDSVKDIFRKLTAGHFPAYYESYWLARNGQHRRIMWSNTVLMDENKEVQYVISTGVDVTQVRAAEGKLRVLTRAMEAGPSSVVITDGNGTVTYVNPAFAQLTGYSQDDVLGKTPRVWKSGRHPPEFYATLWRTLSRGHEWRGEFCNKKKNGELFWVYSTISPIKDETGVVSHFVSVIVDITERKRYEEALEQGRQELEHKVAERTADLQVTIETLQREVEARRRAESEIQDLLQFEHLMAEISTEFTHVQAGSFQSMLKEGIRRLMEFLKVERASLVEFVGEEVRVTMTQNTAGSAPAPLIVSAVELPWSVGQLRQGQRICFSSVDDLPADAVEDRATYHRFGTRSCIALPLVVSAEAMGALVFATVTADREWSPKTVQRLRMAEDLFAGLLLRWRSEDAVSEAETRFHAVANFMQDWEYWESPEGAIRFCSPACERITGYRPEQFLVEPKLLQEIVLLEDAHLWSEFRREAFAHPAQRGLQFRIRRADGQVRWVEHHSQPVTDEQGHFLGLRGSNRDYTAEKEAELEGQRLREELARVSRMTTADHLAASLAHELRQPLAAILSNTEAAQQFLEREPADLNELRDALEDIVRNDERASQIIQRLRALYRRSGQERGPLDLNRLIEETLSLLRSDLILRQVSWEQRLDPELPIVAGNRVEVQQVLMNVIVNARDAMSETDPRSRRLLVCTTLEAPDRVQVSVSDSGDGITPETAAHLFEPFFTTKDSGMGMGLAISRSIIEAHGGRFWAANNPDRGATFHFTIPILKGAS